MRRVGIPLTALMLVVSGCQAPALDAPTFDHERVIAQIDSVNARLIEHQLAAEFEDFTNHYSTLGDGTVASDGAFFGSTAEYVESMQRTFSAVDSIQTFEWLSYKVYPLAPDAAVFAGQYTEMVGMGGQAPAPVVGSFTALFKKEGPDWKMVHVHSSHLQ